MNHSDVTGFGLCFVSISRRVMQLLGDGKHCYLRSGRFKHNPKGTTDLLKLNMFLRINTVSPQEISQIQGVQSFLSTLVLKWMISFISPYGPVTNTTASQHQSPGLHPSLSRFDVLLRSEIFSHKDTTCCLL